MAASVRVMPHIRSASKACKTSSRYRGGVGVAIHLQCGPDKGVHSILACKLTENAIRAKTAIPACEEDIGASTDVFIHSDFASKRMNALNPAALNRGNQRRVWIECPMFTDLASKSQRLPV